MACIRDDSFMARLGGDEFAVLIEGAGGRGWSVAARRILRELSAPILVTGLKLTVEPRSVFRCARKMDATRLLSCCSAATRRAAREGRSRRLQVFDSSIDEER